MVLLLFGFEYAPCETLILDDSMVDWVDLPVGKIDCDDFPQFSPIQVLAFIFDESSLWHQILFWGRRWSLMICLKDFSLKTVFKSTLKLKDAITLLATFSRPFSKIDSLMHVGRP